MPAATATRPPAVGERAPDLSLKSTGGATVSLADFRGRKNALLAFFPLAFTSTCTTELCSFSEDFDQFSRRDVEVLPISVDSVPTLAEFKKKYDMKADLLSDFHREASRAWGVLLEDKNFSTRAYFLIDRDGTIRWEHVESNPSHKRSNAELFEQIGAIG